MEVYDGHGLLPQRGGAGQAGPVRPFGRRRLRQGAEAGLCSARRRAEVPRQSTKILNKKLQVFVKNTLGNLLTNQVDEDFDAARRLNVEATGTLAKELGTIQDQQLCRFILIGLF